MKIDFEKVYQDRIIEIDNQIKKAIYKKNWIMKRQLEYEKYHITRTLKTMDDRKCIQ